MAEKYSLTYRFLRKLGLNFSEKEYGQVSFWTVLKKTLLKLRNAFLLKYCTNSVLLSSINARSIRPKIWRKIGCKVGEGVFIGADCMPDSSNSSLIEIEDGVHIAARSIILCHQRDMSKYFADEDYGKLPYVRQKVHLKKGCLIGTQSIVMPGVTVGEGAIVGAFSLVTKDIPDWTIAIGRPAKVVKKVPQREE
ncbi:Acetyltransferase (isoleucine patch superfamily) [Fodinibius roseus]|uniref:Acetyltransferase (Isoleucine patch superfamily) n=1 Tax=Fodinibius roseus TaxID=1194090 RepID=A0A1M4SR53_9BACT|nr:acyltransferase [Fodinibius roseus]SHE34689.1 Acetyltransferase (isoleucine patch superfamily) [Fodinibius roseus]